MAPGDTLGAIAADAGISFVALLALPGNEGFAENPDLIFPGQTVMLPGDTPPPPLFPGFGGDPFTAGPGEPPPIGPGEPLIEPPPVIRSWPGEPLLNQPQPSIPSMIEPRPGSGAVGGPPVLSLPGLPSIPRPSLPSYPGGLLSLPDFPSLGEITGAVKSSVGGLLEQGWALVDPAIQGLVGGVKAVLDAVVPTLTDVALALAGAVKDGLEFVVGNMVELGDFAGALAAALLTPLEALVDLVGGRLADFLAGLLGAIAAGLEAITGPLERAGVERLI
ncbi:MAG: LysM domain-containing protein [Planctomycetota bacterium]|nr:LysM domain-containing protein [Planctomycetota bacterium]